MRDRALLFTLATLLGVSACGETGGAPVITGISPLSAYSDLPVAMAIASSLRPALVVDIAGESTSYDNGTVRAWLVGETAGLASAVPLAPTVWNGVDTFTTVIPAGTPPGLYAVRVDGPNGKSTTWHGAFHELGPDMSPPLLVVQTPSVGDTLGAGTSDGPATSFTATIFIDDGPGQIQSVNWWTSDGVNGSCPLPPLQANTLPSPAQFPCTPEFPIAPLPDDSTGPVQFSFHVVAVDVSLQVATQDIDLFVAPNPVVDSFEGAIGSLAGFQQLVVHGRYFLPGSQAFVDGVALMGDTVGGDRLDDQTIVGLTPPRAGPNSVTVEVRNPGLTPVGVGRASALFRYLAPPQPRIVQPVVGPASGGIPVTIAGNDLLAGVAISFGRSLETAQPMCITGYTSDNKVVGYLPPGTPGLVSIWASDPITGTGVFMDAFTYSDDEAEAGVVPAPPSPCSSVTIP